MVRLAISAGMDGIPTETIPSDPKEFVDWFKGVGIKRWFGPADVRNVLQGSGIAVTNNGFSSPPTIAISQDFQNLFAQPYVLLGSPVGAPLTDYRSLAAQNLVLSLIDGGAESALTIGVAANGIGAAQFRQSAPLTVVGNATAAIANVSDLSQAQLTALINLATASLSGAIPALSGHSTDYLSGTGAFTALPSVTVPVGANPTASVGLATINGIAATFMRSDGAPSLSQAISPTMTGAWTFSPTGAGVIINAPASGAAVAISGLANTSSVLVQSNATPAQNVTDINVQRANGSTINTLGAGCGIGLQDTANSNATRIQNSGGQTELWQANASTFAQILKVLPGGGVVINAPTSGVAISATAVAGQAAAVFQAASSGNQQALRLQGGAASTDVVFEIENQSTLNNFVVVWGDGHIELGPNVGGSNNGLVISSAGNATCFGKFGINGLAPPAQVTGWGTPAGPAVVSTFPGTPTLAQCGQAIGEIIVALKNFGLFGT